MKNRIYKLYYKRLEPETRVKEIEAKDGYEAEGILEQIEMQNGYMIEHEHQEYLRDA